jgi:hypothetical protein
MITDVIIATHPGKSQIRDFVGHTGYDMMDFPKSHLQKERKLTSPKPHSISRLPANKNWLDLLS